MHVLKLTNDYVNGIDSTKSVHGSENNTKQTITIENINIYLILYSIIFSIPGLLLFIVLMCLIILKSAGHLLDI